MSTTDIILWFFIVLSCSVANGLEDPKWAVRFLSLAAILIALKVFFI